MRIFLIIAFCLMMGCGERSSTASNSSKANAKQNATITYYTENAGCTAGTFDPTGQIDCTGLSVETCEDLKRKCIVDFVVVFDQELTIDNNEASSGNSDNSSSTAAIIE